MKYVFFSFDPRHGYINVGTNAIRRLAEESFIVDYHAQEASGELPTGLFAPQSTDRGFCTNLVTANSKTNILISLLAAKGMHNKFGMAGVASVAGVYGLNVLATHQAKNGKTLLTPFTDLFHKGVSALKDGGPGAATAGGAGGGGWGMIGGPGKREMEMQGGGGDDPMGVSNFIGYDPLNGML